MTKNNKNILIVSIASTLILGTIAYVLYPFYHNLISQDENSVGWILGGIFTMYSLIAAFILVNVWEKFNNLNNLISTEAQKLTSLWTLTDYLDDSVASKNMQQSLKNYLNNVSTQEIDQLIKKDKVPLATQYFTQIMKAIDKIQFDDKRDEPAFHKIIETFEDLSTIRDQRIQTALERIPNTLKHLFQIMTISLIALAFLHSFVNSLLFALSIAILTFITTFLYQIVLDLDDPYSGSWLVDITPYKQALIYITQINHSQ